MVETANILMGFCNCIMVDTPIVDFAWIIVIASLLVVTTKLLCAMMHSTKISVWI